MQNSLKVVGAALMGTGLGFVVGYKLAERRLSEQFDQRLDEETAKMREFYQVAKKPFDTPEEAVAALIQPSDPRVKNEKIAYHKIVTTEGYEGGTDPIPPATPMEETKSNVFDVQRDLSRPYVISQDEFTQNESETEQNTLTWYEQDDVLVDERDDIVDGADITLGQNFRAQFGQQSSDENTVHIRNDKLGLEFEVVRSERSYKEDVLGQEPG
jgi:hypothetical protein